MYLQASTKLLAFVANSFAKFRIEDVSSNLLSKLTLENIFDEDDYYLNQLNF